MLRDDDIPLYMIGIAAQMLSIHPQTLRLYEREGLVNPGRSEGNTRLYSQRDVERIKFILHLTRDMGVNLAGVEVILKMREQMEEMQREMAGVIDYIRGYIREGLKKEMTRQGKMPEVMDKKSAKRPAKKVIRVKAEKRKTGRR